MPSKRISLTYDLELRPGERLTLPEEFIASVGPGRWRITVQPAPFPALPSPVRQHGAFLNGYAPEDEGLYDDAPAR